MSTLTIASFTIQNFHRPGNFARLKIWFGQDFVTAEGQLVLGGADRSGSIYIDAACALDADTHILTVPAIALPTTNDSSVRNVRAVAVLFDSSGALVRYLFTGWIIPAQLAPNSNFAALNDYNAASPRPPDPTYPTTDQIQTLINAAVADSGNLLGTLTANRVPRAATEDTLVDGLIQDDGTTVKIQTLNAVEIGDVDENQNGSYISINDTEGRVSFQAGGDSNAQYAGVSAVAGVDQSEFYIQGSAGNGYNYGSFKNGITKLGDGENENNGTIVEIDDVLELIRLHNLPTSDPGVANALWKSGLDLKISQGQPSESASPSASLSASPSSSSSASPSAS
jgi:hypothetical protein